MSLKRGATMSQVIEAYLEIKKKYYSPTTYSTVSTRIETRILPFFKDYKISRITRKIIEEWEKQEVYAYDLTTGEPSLSDSYKQVLVETLSSIFKFAIDREIIKKNPINARLKVSNVQSKRISYWTNEEFELAIKYISHKPQVYMILKTLFYTGMAYREAYALTKSSINLEKKTITISKTHTVDKGQHIIETLTEETGYRTIQIPYDFRDEFQNYFENEIPEYDYENDVIFMHTSKNVLSRDMDRISKAADIKHITVQDLRHSYIINNFVDGMSIEEIGEIVNMQPEYIFKKIHTSVLLLITA